MFSSSWCKAEYEGNLYLLPQDCSTASQWRTEGGGSTPPPEIPKALQNRAKLNPIVKTVKTQSPQNVRKKGTKILNLPRFAK